MIPNEIRNLIKEKLPYECVEIDLNQTGSVKYINNYGLLVLGGTGEENLGLNWIDMFLSNTHKKIVRTTFQKIIISFGTTYLSNNYPIVTLSGKQINIYKNY
jgi:hypothetical protein